MNTVLISVRRALIEYMSADLDHALYRSFCVHAGLEPWPPPTKSGPKDPRFPLWHWLRVGLYRCLRQRPSPMDRPFTRISWAQVMLHTSLTTFIFLAFVAAFGKQWLKHYASVDMLASAVERDTDRQQKLNNLVTWHFRCVMRLPLLMLQVGLFLLTCTVS